MDPDPGFPKTYESGSGSGTLLHGGLGIGELQLLIKKKFNFFSAVIFFQFLVIKALDPDWIRIRIGLQPQTLDPDPDPEKEDCLEIKKDSREALYMTKKRRLRTRCRCTVPLREVAGALECMAECD